MRQSQSEQGSSQDNTEKQNTTEEEDELEVIDLNMDGVKKVPLREDEAFKKLQDFFDKSGKDLNILEEFSKDPERFSKYQ